jgi:hypothetical protein
MGAYWLPCTARSMPLQALSQAAQELGLFRVVPLRRGIADAGEEDDVVLRLRRRRRGARRW